MRIKNCWGWTVSRPEPNTTPERAMELLVEKARLVFGDQDWSTWEWSARQYGTREPHTIRFRYENWGFVRVAAN